MIVSCPSCGTSYKHRAVGTAARGRCACCDSSIDLSRLRPYRIERAGEGRPEDVGRAAAHLSIGLDEPALADRIAARAAGAMPAPIVPIPSSAQMWDETDPLPEIPEMAATEEFEPPVEEAEGMEGAFTEEASRGASRLAVFGFWATGGAIVGTGTSWTIGGTTIAGSVAGALAGLAAAWGWLRWTSRP